MKIVGVVIDDGRYAFLREAMASLVDHVAPLDEIMLVNDSGQESYAQLIETAFINDVDGFIHHEDRRGLAGAVKSAWEIALALDADYVFHAEGDFTYNEDVPLPEMAQVLEGEPGLAQICLKRQSGNSHEESVGGMVEVAPDEYEERDNGKFVWTEHTRIFSFNPCLIPRAVVQCALTQCSNFLESDVTEVLVKNGYSFALWGGKFDPPKVTHIGTSRSAGYRW